MGPYLQQARTGQLDRLSSLTLVERALIVGEGDGSFLISFARRFPNAAITVVEPSEGMIRRASERLQEAGLDSGRITFIHSELLEASMPVAAFDLIVTLFFFDCFEDEAVQLSIHQLESYAQPQAYWLLSDFCLPESGWRRLRAKFWLKVLYRFFAMTTQLTVRELPNVELLMAKSRFALTDRKLLCGDMLYSALYERIQDS